MPLFRRHLLPTLLLLTTCAIAQDNRSHLQNSLPDSPSATTITGKQRLEWVVKGTVGPKSLITGVFTSGVQTAQNRPYEYGPHWEGFGKRYALRLSGVATDNVMEASLGALWEEDPRYFQSENRALRERLKHVMLMTVAARRADGDLSPAYARFIAMPASNFLSNTWRPNSIANTKDACGRTGLGFVGKLASNAFSEFWPDVKRHAFHSKK